MVSLFKIMLEIALLSSVMIVVILLLRLVFQSKLSIKITMFLWLLVMIRLIVPFTIQFPVQIMGVFPESTKLESHISTPEISNDANETRVEKDDIAINQTQESNRVQDTQAVTMKDESQEAITTEKTSEKQSIFSKFSMLEILAILWLGGVFVALVINIIWVVAFNCKVKKSAFLSDKLIAQKIYNDCHKLNIGKNVSVYECDYIDSPITCGVFRPKILLPADLIKNVGAQKAELIIFHELIHIKNFDILKNYVWMIAKIIYWFNPFVYLGYNRYLEDVELYTDNTVKIKHSKQEILHYSQGLLDVIKLSQGEIRLPTAMPFCKTKIRKRVETMLKPQEKWKVATIASYVVIVILIVACFTTACMSKQPEIETIDIIEKSELKATKTIENKDEIENEQDDKNIESEEEYVNVFEYWTNEAETVTVEIDAEVKMPIPESVPVAQLEKFEISPEFAEHIAKTFFGDVPMIDGTVYTKSMYEQVLINIEESATDMNSDMADESGAKNLEELRKVADIQIEKVKKAMKDAPETAEQVDFNDINRSRGLISHVDIGKEYIGNIHAENTKNSIIRGITCFAFNGEFNVIRRLNYNAASPMSLDKPNKEIQNAKKMAEELVADMGIDGVEISKAFLSHDYTGMMRENVPDPEIRGVLSDRRFYVFVFERMVEDKSIDFTYCQGAFGDPYEKIEVWIEGDKIKEFLWVAPMQIKKVIKNDAEIKIDYLQAVELMKEASINKFVDNYGFNDHFNVNIDEIRLEYLTPVVEGEYTAMPVWVFYGDAFGRVTEKLLENSENKELEVGGYRLQTSRFTNTNIMMCISALDGSVIELEPRS